MKSLRGLTLIEVVTALAITAILLPVLGIVFYNMLVTPPDQSARLVINNELSLLSSWLYNDAHMAENFSVGVFPYYGNFTYTDYSMMNDEGGYNEYLISYYASCPDIEDPDCANSIVRQMIMTNGSLPETSTTPTPTATPTATPTPTATAIPSTQTYTYCPSGGATLAYHRAWNNTEWFTQSHPNEPADFLGSYDRDYTAATSYDRNVLLCSADDDPWGYTDTDSPEDYGVSSQLFRFHVNQDRGNVTSLEANWTGYGGYSTRNIELEIWNNTSNSWTSIADATDPDCWYNDTYTWDTSSSPEDYIEEGTGYLTLLASADADGTTPDDFDLGDALYFNGSASNTMTTNSTVPTDTFTFEAWVKCTEEITMYSEATSGAPGTSGQHYLFWPTHGGASDAGVGLSVGTNGISVYEHGSGYLPPLAAYTYDLGTVWNHIAVVYDSNVAKIYLNGDLVRTGLTSTKGTAYAPNIVGYGASWDSGVTYSYFTGWVDEVRIWNIALNESQIQDNMYTENPTAAGTATVRTVYTSDDSFTPPAGVTSVEVLVVAGGGGGGGAYTGANYFHGGGGGAGGVVYDDDFTVTPGIPITVTVGAGGAGGMGYSSGTTYAGDNGEDSVFGTITADGGGGGGGGHSTDSATAYGEDGGSGGGSGVYCSGSAATNHEAIGQGGTGTAGQGYDGGIAWYECCWGGLFSPWCTCPARSGAGGGGGASEAGGDAGTDADYYAGDGGDGVDYSGTFGAVGGDSGWFGGGGGGGHIPTRIPGTGGQGGGGDGGGAADGQDATANTGGGGGGAGSNDSSDRQGGDGGSGIVIVQYEAPGENLKGCWHFNNCSNDILDGVMEDSSTYDNDGTLSSPAPECGTGVSRDLTVYTDYVALTVESIGAPVPTVGPTPTPVTSQQYFTSSGTFNVPEGVNSVQVLVVAGGGGGGGASTLYYCGGGGGAGGVLYDADYSDSVTPSGSITVTVGAGGGGGSGNANGTDGGNSVFGTLTATGGGGGGAGGSAGPDGRSGGSGGGGAARTSSHGSGGSGTSGQGNNGGAGFHNSLGGDNAAGGGGGAGATGGVASKDDAGDGGTGADYSSIFGTGVGASGWFGGGGGGGCYNGNHGTGGTGGGGAGDDNNGTSTGGDGGGATANTGGGGGGAAAGWWSGNRNGGAGGSGAVVVRYTVSYKTLTTAAGTGGNMTTPAPPGDYYYTGETVNIVATPDECYEFDEWIGDTSTIADVNDETTTIVMNDDYSITATFVASTNTYSLTVDADPSSGGNPYFEETNPFICGTDVPIFANPETGATFTGWLNDDLTTDGIADASLSDTTVHMTEDRNLTAYFNMSPPTPTPEPAPRNLVSTLHLTQHVTAGNFSLSRSGDLIKADMYASVASSMGKFVNKSLTIYLRMRPAYLLPEPDPWTEDTCTLNGFLISGDHNTISGSMKINGSVTVDAAAENNMIDGTLTCPSGITWPPPGTPDTSKLDYTKLVNGNPYMTWPGREQQAYFSTNLSLGIEVLDDDLQEYVFNGNVDLTDYDEVWDDPGTYEQLKTGRYYSPGTITLEGSAVRGSVTFVADRIILINDTSSGLDPDAKIALEPCTDDLLFWANGSVGTTGEADGDILIQGRYEWSACASLEGILYAPNGEIELHGNGGLRWGFPAPAELYNCALIAQDLSIPGSRWNIYRW